MATIILKNNDITDIVINDLGNLTIPFAEQITASDLFLDGEVYESIDLKTLVSAGDVIVNDGSSDLSISNALEFLTIYNFNAVSGGGGVTEEDYKRYVLLIC